MPTRKPSHDALLVALQLIDLSVDRLSLAGLPAARAKLGSAMAQILEVVDGLRQTTSELGDSAAISKRLDLWQLDIFKDCMKEIQNLEANERISDAIERCISFLKISGSIKLRALARDELERLQHLRQAKLSSDR